MRRYQVGDEAREELLSDLAEKLGVRSDILVAYAHGSVVASSGHVGDIDVAVLLDDLPEESAALDAEIALERDLGEGVEIPLDVRVLNHAPLTFRYAVLRDGIILVSRSERARERFECGTLALYHDFSHHLRNYRRDALGLEA